MKKFYLQSLFLIGFCFILQSSFGQAQRYPMFEHYTQASCGPCALYNPGFQSLYYTNEGKVHHIAVHTSWPGYDPMYNSNPTESDEMVDYYGVTGVPDLYQDGEGLGGPTGATQALIDASILETSPISVIVSETTVGSTRDVTITINSVGSVPAGSYVLKAAVVEKIIEYGSAPGSNGETEFPNVMRDMLTSTSGDAITLATMGGSEEVTFNYTLDGSWLPENIYVIAWVVNASTKEILNSGSTFDPSFTTVLDGPIATSSTSGSMTVFSMDLENIGAGSTNLLISISSDAPADWDAFLMFGSDMYMEDEIEVTLSDLEMLMVHVTPGATPNVGEYTLTIKNADIPEAFSSTYRFAVISDITDLVINNHNPTGGTGPLDTYDNNPFYEDGLAFAANEAFDHINHEFILSGGLDALDGVKNIYFNCGWTFPTLTNEMVAVLSDFLDIGGNLLIAGQDIGWEVNDATSTYGTPENQAFYADYLHAGFVEDNSGEDYLTSVEDNLYFTAGLESDIDDVYSSGSNDFYFPDRIESADASGFPILYYAGDDNNVAAIRSETATYKTVYFGLGLEMIEDDAIRNELVKRSHDYFYNKITGIEFESALQNLFLSVSPNPTSDFATISFETLDAPMFLTITDITGKTISAVEINAGATTYILDASQLESGMYFYSLSNGNTTTETFKLNILK